MNKTTEDLAVQGYQMRNAQKDYFKLANVARKTKTTTDWAAASHALRISKQLEEKFDATVYRELNP